MALSSDHSVDLHLVGAGAGAQCFPFFTYAEDGTNQRENITDWALAQFQAAYGPDVTKRDIFDYIYAVLHHPQYRERYAENLKRELPRIPLVGLHGAGHEPEAGAAGDGAAFRALVAAGAELARLHVGYEQAAPYPLREVQTAQPFSWHVKKMALTRDRDAVIVNESLRLEGLTSAVFDYRLGNRSALEWVIDQYQVATDARSGITTDPNRADDPQYIVRLVKQVVAVSLTTVRIVAGLPDLRLSDGDLPRS